MKGRRFFPLLCVGITTALWLALLAPTCDLFRPDASDAADRLQAAQVQVWSRAPVARSSVQAAYAANPEWDFMGRTFHVLALANQAFSDYTARDENLQRIDALIKETIALEAEHGQHHFLLPYADRAPFRDARGRSVFVDGEIALMIAARLNVRPDNGLEAELHRRVHIINDQMRSSPTLSAESYPNECWTFCNTTALAAVTLADRVLDTNHDDLREAWVSNARANLVDPETGLLVSSYTWDGEILDGPEGSTLWMATHNLQLVDAEFARNQYEIAKQALATEVLGFAWAAEWPDSGASRSVADIDSGPVVPVLNASPGSSGLLLLGATAFEDDGLRDALLRSMELAAFPIDDGETRRYAAAGVIGDSVALYALRFGPLWHPYRDEI